MKLRLPVISFILAFFWFYLRAPSFVGAVFFDDFSSGNLDLWTTFSGGYSINAAGQLVPGVFGWNIENYDSKNYLVGKAGIGEHSYIYTNDSFKNFFFESEMENKSGIDLSIRFRVNEDASKFYELEYRFKDPNWSDNNNFVLYKYQNGMYYGPYVYVMAPTLGFDLTQNVKHKIKILMVENILQAYFDDTRIFQYEDLDPFLVGRLGFKNWGGSYGNLENRFSYIKVSDAFASSTPTPTPEPTIVPTPTLIPTTIPTSTPTFTPTSTPTPLPTPTIAPSPTAVPIKPKIVILPGLGASWNLLQ